MNTTAGSPKPLLATLRNTNGTLSIYRPEGCRRWVQTPSQFAQWCSLDSAETVGETEIFGRRCQTVAPSLRVTRTSCFAAAPGNGGSNSPSPTSPHSRYIISCTRSPGKLRPLLSVQFSSVQFSSQLTLIRCYTNAINQTKQLHFGATVYINNVIILHIYSISNQYTLCPKKNCGPELWR